MLARYLYRAGTTGDSTFKTLLRRKSFMGPVADNYWELEREVGVLFLTGFGIEVACFAICERDRGTIDFLAGAENNERGSCEDWGGFGVQRDKSGNGYRKELWSGKLYEELMQLAATIDNEDLRGAAVFLSSLFQDLLFEAVTLENLFL